MKIAILFGCVFSITFAGIPWEPEFRDEEGWLNLHNSFVENTRTNNGSIRVVFYGDGNTQRWGSTGEAVFHQYYASLGAANYGISGDLTEHVLWRIQNGEVTNDLLADVCVVQIGTNNLNSGVDSDEDIALGIARIVFDLQSRAPNMKILLTGVLPRTDEEMTNRTIQINNNIRRLASGSTATFLDLKDYFYNGGNSFNSDLYDGPNLLGLSEAGYRKWAQVMDPMLRQMIGSF